MINKRLRGKIVDAKQVLRSNKVVTKYKIYVASKQCYYWLTDFYFIPMQEVKQNRFKLVLLNILSKLTFIKIHIEFKELETNN
jgi:hypothetical protein